MGKMRYISAAALAIGALGLGFATKDYVNEQASGVNARPGNKQI